MKYKCSLCDYVSNNKQDVNRHFNKKNKCGEGKHTVIEIKTNINCIHCNKSLSTYPHLTKHLKLCKVKKINIELELEKQKNKDLEKENEILRAIATKPTIGAQYNQINIILTPYNDPNLTDIEKHLETSIKKLFLAVPTLVKKIHFNEKNPENHNLVIKNSRTKIAKVFNGKIWITMNEEQLLDELVNTYENLLDTYATKHSPKYIIEMNNIKNRDSEEKVYEDMKVDVKYVLYDNRDMININKYIVPRKLFIVN
jgi:hypothetical protein